MATWRFMTAVEDEVLRAQEVAAAPPERLEALEGVGIFEVVDGTALAFGERPDSDTVKIVPPGWYTCVVPDSSKEAMYSALALRVRMCGRTVEMVRGTPIILFPREHLETARDSAPTVAN